MSKLKAEVIRYSKKFNITNNPKVINFDIHPDPSWVFLNTSKPKSDKYLIVLNYIENPNIFQSFAMNIGIKKSQGEWIMRLDAHTIYPKNYLVSL